MKKALVSIFVAALLFCLAPAAHAENWIYLGQAHVDGQHDHDNIEVGKYAGRYRFLQVRVNNAPIEFDRIVVHYGNGQAEQLQVREVIRKGSRSRAIPLAGDAWCRAWNCGTAKRIRYRSVRKLVSSAKSKKHRHIGHPLIR
jgi:hypothetical protein